MLTSPEHLEIGGLRGQLVQTGPEGKGPELLILTFLSWVFISNPLKKVQDRNLAISTTPGYLSVSIRKLESFYWIP